MRSIKFEILLFVCKRLLFLTAVFMLFCPVTVRAEGKISIDASRKYKGMKASFANGYEPSIQKNVMYLVVPFAADAELEKNRITVGIDFEKQKDSPFFYKNYQKQVRQNKDKVYLYQCRIKLKADRRNGQYPLRLWVEGKENGCLLREEFTIYVEITDGKENVRGKVDEKQSTEEEGSDKKILSEEWSASLEESPSDLDQNIPQEALDGSSSEQERQSSQPRLMINQNNLRAETLEAGTGTLWNISVQNCSSRDAIENIKITLVCESKDLIFEKSAWYFEKAAPQAAMDLSQNIIVSKKALPEPATVQFQIEYADKSGGNYTSLETVRLMVSQPQQAELVNVSFPEQVYASDTQILTFQVQNSGLSAIYNVKVSIEAKGLFASQQSLLGNVEGGAVKDGEQQIFVGTLTMDEDGTEAQENGEKYGDTSGNVILTYENEQGEVTKKEVQIHTFIQEPDTIKLDVEKEKPKTNQWWITIVVLLILVLLLLIFWMYLRMKHYQRMIREKI